MCSFQFRNIFCIDVVQKTLKRFKMYFYFDQAYNVLSTQKNLQYFSYVFNPHLFILNNIFFPT